MSFIVVNIGRRVDDAGSDAANLLLDSKDRCRTSTCPAHHTGIDADGDADQPGVDHHLYRLLEHASALLSNCYGNLGPGEGVRITVDVHRRDLELGVRRPARPIRER